MTRFARINRSRHGEECKATPWSSLSKVRQPEDHSLQKEEDSDSHSVPDIEEQNKPSFHVTKNKETGTEDKRSLPTESTIKPVEACQSGLNSHGVHSYNASANFPTSSSNLRFPRNNRKNKNAFQEISRKLDSCDQTLEDVKKLVTSYVQKGLVTREDAGRVVKRWKNSERRRIGRQLSKAAKAACYLCRQPGHTYSECPERDESNMGVGICYKCGSLEHGSAKCPRKNVVGYPYAFCFICKRQGHISRDCEQNPNGIYPDGGSCNLCGSQAHLKRDCPELNLRKDSKKKETMALLGNDMTGGDEEVTSPEPNSSIRRQKPKLKEKMVHF